MKFDGAESFVDDLLPKVTNDNDEVEQTIIFASSISDAKKITEQINKKA